MNLPHFVIHIDGKPYLGGHSSIEIKHPRPSGWTGLSPATRSRISIGHHLDVPKAIQGRRNLRSELERVLAEIDYGLQVKQITISKI